MPVGPATVVNGPALQPAPHSLVASVPDITPSDNRWEMGFAWTPELCASMSAWDSCDGGSFAVSGSADMAKSDAVSLDMVEYRPFTLELAVTCSSTGYDTLDFPGRARRAAEAATSPALEAEFWSGSLNQTNPHLASNGGLAPTTATVLNGGTATEPACAIGFLNEALGDCGVGGRGVIHMPQRAAAVMSLLLTEEGQRLVTKVRRSVVVAGSGYPGTSRTGGSPSAGQQWVYATGPVGVMLGPVEVLSDNISEVLARRTNTLEYRAERTAAAIFDPCCLFAILVDIDCSTPV